MPPLIRRLQRSFPPVLWSFAIATLLLSLGCKAAELFCKRVLQLQSAPYANMIFDRGNDYMDARMFVLRFKHFHDASFFTSRPDFGADFLYPAPDALIYWIFRFSPWMSQTMVIFIGLVIMAIGVWLFVELRRRGIDAVSSGIFAAICLVSSYPMYFEFNRGNVEIFIWGLCALGILAFFRDRPWLAATLIGIAGACKGYPFIYLGLLFARKQYRQMVYSIILGTLLNLFSMWAVAGDFNVGRKGVSEGLEEFRQLYVLHIRPTEIDLDHSIFGLLKRLFMTTYGPDQIAHDLNIYLAVAALVACALYFLRAYHMPPVNQVIFLSVACMVLPPTSYDYTLLHVYSGWMLLVLISLQSWRVEHAMPPGLWPAFLCLIVLCSPQNEFIWNGMRMEGPIKCVALLALGAVALIFPFATPKAAAGGPQWMELDSANA